jgi:hypothetical protein
MSRGRAGRMLGGRWVRSRGLAWRVSRRAGRAACGKAGWFCRAGAGWASRADGRGRGAPTAIRPGNGLTAAGGEAEATAPANGGGRNGPGGATATVVRQAPINRSRSGSPSADFSGSKGRPARAALAVCVSPARACDGSRESPSALANPGRRQARVPWPCSNSSRMGAGPATFTCTATLSLKATMALAVSSLQLPSVLPP